MRKSRLDKILDRCNERVVLKEVVPAVLVGGPGHRGRAIIFLLSESTGVPEFVIKMAFTEKEAEYLTQEFNALRDVRGTFPDSVTSRIPDPMALLQIDGETALICRALKGRRLVIPTLTKKYNMVGQRMLRGYFQQAFNFSQDLGRTGSTSHSSRSASMAEVVARFRDLFGGQGGADHEIVAFEREVLKSQIIAEPSWQHCDMMMSNVLEDNKELRFLDWEHSRPSSQSWFDIAYAPIALALMASWQTRQRFQGVITRVLSTRSWTGRILSEEMNRVWRFPLPLSWGVLLTAMETAVRQEIEGRTASSDWSIFVHTILGRSEKQELAWLSEW